LLQVRGYQCDIGLGRTGTVLIARGPMPLDMPTQNMISNVWKAGSFNDFLIRCVGMRVTTQINGFTMYDGIMPGMPEEGLIAWNLHGGMPPKEVTIKDVEIRLIDQRPKEAPGTVGSAGKVGAASRATNGPGQPPAVDAKR